MSNITNILFGDDDPVWLQASLPVRFGGLGFWSAVQLASSAFLASAAASSNLVSQIIPARLQSLPTPYLDVALSCWSQCHDIPPPSGSAACIQKSWDATIESIAVESLLENSPDDLARARLLATSSAHPISSLGLRMDDNTISVAVGLHLGSTLCRPHSCQHCGVEVDYLATHRLSCR